MRLSWFKNEEGSTSLTMVLGIMLSVVLLASSVQWYWTSSTSSDIQVVADIGALAAADVTAQSVMLIQALDAMLLTANLFGLVLHAITIVAGLLAVLSAPVGGVAATPFLERIVDFNYRYCKKRREFAQHAYQLASVVSEATPYLAMATSYYSATENSRLLGDFNGTAYTAIAIPFPLRGKVELTNSSDDADQLLQEVTRAGKENTESAHEIKRLEGDVEAAVDECFRLNVFLPPGTSRTHWNPLSAIDDFARGWGELQAQSIPAIDDPVPIDNTQVNRDRLQERYLQDYRRIGQSVDEQVRVILDRAAVTEAADVADISMSDLLGSERGQRIYVLERADGDRRAYHSNPNCFGLAGSTAELRTRTLSYVAGDVDHPPCVLCEPPHWRALQIWEQQLAEYVQSWNFEAAALRWWYQATESIELEQDQVRERTQDAFDLLLEESKSFLIGNRLSYTPAGARGYICVVVSSEQRELPAFTLPVLTASEDVVLGRQVAMAGARLMPSGGESTIPSLLSQSADMADSAGVEGFAGVTHELLGGEDDSFAGSVIGFALSIWGSCLQMHADGSAQIERLMLGLPFGLDSIATSSLRSFFDTAQISAPDLRRPMPTLVSTSDVGDINASGFEGSFVQSVVTAKEGLEQSGGASIAGMREAISGMINELDADVSSRIEELMQVRVLGVSIPLPFSQTVQNMASTAFESVRGREQELFVALGF